MKERFAKWCKKEIVLVIAGAAALISCFFVPPSASCFGYLDMDVLVMLFCLMTVVAGLSKLGVFAALAGKLMAKVSGFRALSVILIWLCFFAAMFMTNDVALLTFVPLSVAVFGPGGQKRLIYVISTETIAANLGSMLTPVGNPQNLFLYSHYGFSLGDFLRITGPFTLASLIIVTILALITPEGQARVVSDPPALEDKKKLVLYLMLFLVCLLTVAGLLSHLVMLILVAATVLAFDRKVFLGVDYSLLATFVCFFVFVGNLKGIESFTQFMQQMMQGREMLVSVAASQVISNVPAAVMLSSFTDSGKALLVGTNLGGLGTLVASLASLISYKLYAQQEGAQKGKYLAVFTLLNVVVLALLLILAAWMG